MHDEIELEMALLQPSIEEQKRHLVFSGAKNFRDLGGYQTVDGGLFVGESSIDPAICTS